MRKKQKRSKYASESEGIVHIPNASRRNPEQITKPKTWQNAPYNIHQKWQVKPARASKVFVFTLS